MNAEPPPRAGRGPGPDSPGPDSGPGSVGPGSVGPGSVGPGSVQPSSGRTGGAVAVDAVTSDPERRGDPPRRGRRWARAVMVALSIAVIITVIVVDRSTLAKSLSDLGSLDFPWFVLAVVFELASLSAFGLSRRRLLRADGHQAAFGSVMAITYAGNALSMSIPFAGAELAAVFSYRQFRRRGLDPALTGWALGVSAIASSSALALVLVTGALAAGKPLATALGFLGGIVFALPAITVILALRFPQARVFANRVIAWALRLASRIVRRPGIDQEALDEFLQRLASIRLGWLSYAEVFGLAVANWLFDCACLACAIRAVGQPVPWQGLLVAYGAGAIVGSTGVTPGGFLVVEATLTAALTGIGMNSGAALAAVLAYRLVNFWMILLGGWITMIVLTRMRDSRIRHYHRIDDSPGEGEKAGVGDKGSGGW
jgi:putative heme transporter